jgi:fucose 4-O-acetylase-like acetyltransferase
MVLAATVSHRPNQGSPTLITTAPVRTERLVSRDPYFDNAKFLAVVLVVIGHAWEPLRGANIGGRLLEAAQTFIYAFHLPAFIVMCGYFSRGFTAARGRTRKLVAAIVVPYAIFSVAYPLWAGLLAGDHVGWDPLEPYYLTWFLPALLLWRLSTPLWQQIRHPIAAALLISMIAGFVTLPSMLNAAQVLSFLPFFVIGLTLRPGHFALLQRRAVRFGGAALLVLGGAAAYALAVDVDPEWVHWRRSFDQLGVGAPAGVGFRIAALAAAVTLTAAFLAVVPVRRTWFTRLGAATMYAYLLHGFVTLFLSYQGWYYRVSGGEVVLVTVGCAVLTVVLSGDTVRGVFRWAVEPRLDWLFRTAATSRAPAAAAGKGAAGGGEDDAQDVPAAGADLPDTLPRRDPPVAPGSGHGPVADGGDQSLAGTRPGDRRP